MASIYLSFIDLGSLAIGQLVSIAVLFFQRGSVDNSNVIDLVHALKHHNTVHLTSNKRVQSVCSGPNSHRLGTIELQFYDPFQRHP